MSIMVERIKPASSWDQLSLSTCGLQELRGVGVGRPQDAKNRGIDPSLYTYTESTYSVRSTQVKVRPSHHV